VNDPTDVSNETYVASADILVIAASGRDAGRTIYAVWCIECSSVEPTDFPDGIKLP